MSAHFLYAYLIFASLLAVPQQSVIGDFTPSPNEHIINSIDEPFVVRSLRGAIELADGDPLPGVLFEIQGPGTDRRMRKTTTDKSGHFKISHMLAGEYRFKATLISFQSVMGTIRISNKANKRDIVKIKMRVGV